MLAGKHAFVMSSLGILNVGRVLRIIVSLAHSQKRCAMTMPPP